MLGRDSQLSWASPRPQTVENLPAMEEIQVQSLGWEDSLEEGMVTHSSILPEEPGRLQSMESQRVEMLNQKFSCSSCAIKH